MILRRLRALISRIPPTRPVSCEARSINLPNGTPDPSITWTCSVDDKWGIGDGENLDRGCQKLSFTEN